MIVRKEYQSRVYWDTCNKWRNYGKWCGRR